jgi:hypothetical protein
MHELLSGSSGRLVLRLNFWMRFGVRMLRALRGSNAVPRSGHWVDCRNLDSDRTRSHSRSGPRCV